MAQYLSTITQKFTCSNCQTEQTHEVQPGGEPVQGGPSEWFVVTNRGITQLFCTPACVAAFSAGLSGT